MLSSEALADLDGLYWETRGKEKLFQTAIALRLSERGWQTKMEFITTGNVGGKLADIFASKGDTRLIIECKIKDAEQGLGQVLLYSHLYRTAFGLSVIPVLTAPYWRWPKGLAEVCESQGVDVWCLSPAPHTAFGGGQRYVNSAYDAFKERMGVLRPRLSPKERMHK